MKRKVLSTLVSTYSLSITSKDSEDSQINGEWIRGRLLLSTPERVSTSYSRANEPATSAEDIPRTIATVPILPSLLALQNCQNLFRIPVRQPDTFVTVQLRQFEPRRFPRASPPSFLQSRSSGIRKKNQLSFLFYSLVNLRKLCIRSCEHTCDLFIRHARYVNPLLEYLHLESDSYWPLDPSFLDTISIYSNLRHLSLIRLELPEAASSSSPSPSTVLRFPNLTSLELGGDLTPLAVQDLFSRCSPTSIVLVEDCEEDEWFPNVIPAILAKVEEPKLVKKLVLD